VIDASTTLSRRLERYRAATRPPPASLARVSVEDLAAKLAEAVDGEVVRGSEGVIVRRDTPSRPLAVDRWRLAELPGQPPPDVPLVCLDTETTGLATAAGTMAFLIGLGWWEADSFRQVQLLLPDHAEERALLTALEAAIPRSAWLVTYNGRGFDWPLLTTRFRMARRSAPAHAGHLDLLPTVRRLFRHRMADARLRTAEAELLGLHRVGDVDGWEIPGRYLRFLAGAPATELAEVVRHNDQDVRSLGRLMAYLETRLGDPGVRAEAPPGDLAGLGRAFARERRLSEALDCLEAAIDRPIAPPPAPSQRSEPPVRTRPSAWSRPAPASGPQPEEPWWSPRRPADYGGRPNRPVELGPPRTAQFDARWTSERILIERAHLLRRIGRHRDAVDAWSGLMGGSGRTAVVAAIEVSKLREHRLRDRPGSLVAALHGLDTIERRRRLGRPEPALEADLHRRVQRLRHRLARQPQVARPPTARSRTRASVEVDAARPDL
jgi:hypothetical protein